MAEICLEKTVPQTIDAKKRMLLNNRIALWDVCKACNVKGSLDSSIKNVEPNDIGSLINASRIKVIFFNGKKACQLFERHFKYNDIGVPDWICLPSTSPANTTRYEIKLDEWKKNVTKYLDCFKKG